MSEASLTDVDLGRHDYPTLEHLSEQMRDLLLVHVEHQLALEFGSPQHLHSLFLNASQYVSGGKSDARSYMRFALSLHVETAVVSEGRMLTLELAVSNREPKPCLVQSSEQ